MFIEYLLYARHCAKCFMCVGISRVSENSIKDRWEKMVAWDSQEQLASGLVWHCRHPRPKSMLFIFTTLTLYDQDWHLLTATHSQKHNHTSLHKHPFWNASLYQNSLPFVKGAGPFFHSLGHCEPQGGQGVLSWARGHYCKKASDPQLIPSQSHPSTRLRNNRVQ